MYVVVTKDILHSKAVSLASVKTENKRKNKATRRETLTRFPSEKTGTNKPFRPARNRVNARSPRWLSTALPFGSNPNKRLRQLLQDGHINVNFK
ncbi:hypothetical protein AOLI_G00169320 [Acnodon oligacanthus]